MIKNEIAHPESLGKAEWLTMARPLLEQKEYTSTAISSTLSDAGYRISTGKLRFWRMTKCFYAVLANSLVASLTNNFVWFAVTFWVYLQTEVSASDIGHGGHISLGSRHLWFFSDRWLIGIKENSHDAFKHLFSYLYILTYVIFCFDSTAVFTDPCQCYSLGFHHPRVDG